MKNLTERQIKKIEIEIYECIKLISSENKAKGYDWNIRNYKEYEFKNRLSKRSFDFLKNGQSKYGKFNTYGGHWGMPYQALNYSIK